MFLAYFVKEILVEDIFAEFIFVILYQNSKTKFLKYFLLITNCKIKFLKCFLVEANRKNNYY